MRVYVCTGNIKVTTLFVQFVQYWVWYRDDKLGLRITVVGLQVLTVVKSAQCLYVFRILARCQTLTFFLVVPSLGFKAYGI